MGHWHTSILQSFNTQPPEGGWFRQVLKLDYYHCFNTQPPEGGWAGSQWARVFEQSFNTQPPEGGWNQAIALLQKINVFQHTAARGRLGMDLCYCRCVCRFQHTAARGRLEPIGLRVETKEAVSTHSRPRAAGSQFQTACRANFGFNTQPPEGGWEQPAQAQDRAMMFQHTAARGRLA